MALKREQVVQSAEKYVARGRIDAGIREYRKLLAENPNDTNTLNRVGDLYARIDRVDEAIQLFSQIADQYTRDGFFVKAIAIYKKIIKLDPTQLEVYERLAALYHRQGLTNEARSQYQVLADYYEKHANAASALNIHQKMAELEPENPSHPLKLAELFQARGLIDKAIGQYQRIAELMLAKNHVEEATKVYLRALELDPSDLSFVTDAVLSLKNSGHIGPAAQILSAAVERNPAAGRIARLAGVGGPALAHEEEEATGPRPQVRDAEASAPVEIELEPEPETDAGFAAEEVEPPPAPAASDRPAGTSDGVAEAASPPALQAPLEELEEIEWNLDAEADLAEAATQETAPLPEIEIDAELLEQTAAEVEPPAARREEDLVAEAEVFAKYGLEEKALERLREVLQINPHNLEAREHLIGLYLRREQHERVPPLANELRRLAVQAGESDLWEKVRSRLVRAEYRLEGDRVLAPPRRRDRTEDRIARLLESLMSDTAADAPPSGRRAQAVGEPPGQPTAAAPPAETPVVGAGETRLEVAETTGVEETAVDGAGPGAAAEEDLSIELGELEIGDWQEEEVLTEDTGPGPSETAEAASSERVEPEAAVAGESADGAEEPGGEEEAPVASAGEESASLAWLDEPAAEGSEGGAESLFAQEEFFDLAAELEDELSREEGFPSGDLVSRPEEQSLEEIVEGFKRGVAESLSPEDYDTHFNLGIAYREMGLLDEAIGEFQLSAKDPRYLVDCCSLLGLCFVDKGLPELAIKWYRRGLEAPRLGEEAMLGLLYDMGNVFQSTGDLESAYKTFVEIYGVNSNYRDIVARLEELGGRGR